MSDWPSVALHYLVRFGNGQDYADVEVLDGLYPVIGSGGPFARTDHYLFDGESVLFGRKGTIDKPRYESGRFWTVDTMFYSVPGPRVIPRWLYYWALTVPFDLYSTSTALPSMTSAVLGRLRVNLPPLAEQRAIADYLDRETAKIDTLIEKQATMIERLKERRVILLWSAITGRSERFCYDRRPAAPWAGDIPNSWTLVPLRALLKERGEMNRRLQSCDYLSLMARRGVIPYADKGDVGNRAPEDLSRCKIVHVGDFVLNSMNYQIGSFGVSPYAGVCSPAYLVLQGTGRGDARFIHAVLSCPAFQQYAQNLGDGILAHRRAITWSDLMAQMVPFPPLDEQREIADYLDRETAKIDTLIAKVEQHIALAKERRAALITAAVTGQIDVTTSTQSGDAA